MKNLKLILILSAFAVLAVSCTDDITYDAKSVTNLNGTTTKNQRVPINRFSSSGELSACIRDLSTVISQSRHRALSVIPTTPTPNDTVPDLFTPVGDASNYTDDNIVSYEMQISKELLIKNGDLTLYEACGYDSIVPDTAFAKLLNIKGEIQVADTVYKISPRGTYYFVASLEKYFTDNFEKLEKKEGVQIGEKTYKIDDKGIYLFESFDQDVIEDEASTLADSINESLTPQAPPLNGSFADKVNWDAFPTYNADAKTIVGKVWQSLFGRNKSYYYKISKKRRVRSKFFFYDYRVHASIGAEVEMQKKNKIGWSGTKADKLTLNWHHIVLEYDYPNGKPENYGSRPYIISTPNAKIPSLTKTGTVTSIFGINISKKDIDKFVAKGAKNLYSVLNSTLKNNNSGSTVPENSRAYVLYGPKKIQYIIPDGCIEDVSRPKLKKKFVDTWGFVITFNLNYLNGDWKSMAKSLLGMNVNSPKLIGGVIRAGACIDDHWGAITTVKQ